MPAGRVFLSDWNRVRMLRLDTMEIEDLAGGWVGGHGGYFLCMCMRLSALQMQRGQHVMKRFSPVPSKLHQPP